MTAITGGLISLAEKGAAKVIAGALSEEKGIDGQMILASNAAYDAGLTAPDQLDGKSIGVTQPGSSFHYMGAKIAEAEGANVSFKPLQKVGAIIGALKSGQVDAWTIVPHIGKALAGGGAVKHIGMVADYLPDYQVTTVFTSAANAGNPNERVFPGGGTTNASGVATSRYFVPTFNPQLAADEVRTVDVQACVRRIAADGSDNGQVCSTRRIEIVAPPTD